MYIQNYSETTYFTIKDGAKYLSWGWIGNEIECVGKTPDCILMALDALVYAQDKSDTMLGVHTCGVCRKFKDRGSFYVQLDNETRLLMPRMIIHYIKSHSLFIPVDIQTAINLNYKILPTPVISHKEDRYYKAFGLQPVSVNGEFIRCRAVNDVKPEVVQYLKDICGKNVELV